jgi:hypothetical protein
MRYLLLNSSSLVAVLALGCGGDKVPGRSKMAAEQRERAEEPRQAGNAAGKAAPRKIIYTGFVDLIVDDFDGSESRLLQLVEDNEGYLAESAIYNQPHSPRSGTWIVRIPNKHFDAFMAAVAKLGEVRKRTSNSQDVTDVYYDTAAHLKADEAEEKSLLGLLEKTQGRVEDILKVREQVRIVRGHIEANKSQLQRWDKDVEMATVTVTLLDRRDYTPPLMPDFGSSVGRTFQSSIEALVAFGKGIVLVLVALAPWLAVLALFAVPLAIIWRRRRAANTVIAATESPGAATRQTGG